MLTAAKNLSSVFTEFEAMISKNYSFGWIDFNTSVFIRYFFQTEFVQNKIYRCLEVSKIIIVFKIKSTYFLYHLINGNNVKFEAQISLSKTSLKGSDNSFNPMPKLYKVFLLPHILLLKILLKLSYSIDLSQFI